MGVLGDVRRWRGQRVLVVWWELVSWKHPRRLLGQVLGRRVESVLKPRILVLVLISWVGRRLGSVLWWNSPIPILRVRTNSA